MRPQFRWNFWRNHFNVHLSRHNYTQKNHYKFGCNRQWFHPRKGIEQSWDIEYGECRRPVRSWGEECIEAARQIGKTSRQEIWLLFSGGVDSEVMVRAFLAAKVPFRVAIFAYPDGLNSHDIRYAIEVCRELNIDFTPIAFDPRVFWREKGLEYARKSQCRSPQLLAIMRMAEQLPGIPVIGSGDTWVEKESKYDDGVYEWYLWEDEKTTSLYRFFIHERRRAYPGFFQYTPELILSYLKDPFVCDLVNERLDLWNCGAAFKGEFYQQHFPIKLRPKYTGFEHLNEEDLALRGQLEEKYPFDNSYSGYTYDDAIKVLSGCSPELQSINIGE